MQRHIDPTQLVEDWLGNNIAVTCPLCSKVFVVSGLLNRGGRKCPKCGNSVGIVEGGRDSGGAATIQTESSQMTVLHAEQIATLINQRNRLSREYEGKDILCYANNYEYETRDGNVVSCVERKRVQWYQWEVCHLSVAKAWEHQGLASIVYQRAEEVARRGNARVIQCTIREGNADSTSFFDKRGFLKVGRFLNAETRNAVGIWQKILTPPQAA